MSKKEFRAVEGIFYKDPEKEKELFEEKEAIQEEEPEKKELEGEEIIEEEEVITKSEEDKPKKIEGYAAVYDSISEDLGGFKEIIKKGAFSDSINDPENDIRALVDHDSSKIIGRRSAGTLDIIEDEKGVYVSITPPNTTAGKDLVESISRRDIDGMSVGFQVVDELHDENGVRVITKADLVEVSAVTFPAYKATEVSYRKITPLDEGHDFGDEDPYHRNIMLLRHVEILEKLDQ